MRISIYVDEKMMRALKKRAKDNLLSVREMVEDIVRKSMVSYMKRWRRRRIKVDDILVQAFSRDGRGKKRKR
ncbi:hypothetical protein COU62_03590 [Candidatus Pacearchaeota archaeon CG10_big_fil_rev_8_21_14_0_10_35_219]|nr:ribbon-helix-helix protein, CopG family [Candidatus Pacearchaeota archaeon]OIO42330.1 MAG: hypothetical protein AUJ63_03585 [Candidatus Pacearchaeota archaeon CG1_02_35_32]PIO07435.1 MAG: hypothetical protein COU62_03590 [Candidatus Pacearchaeota archaeon CG10_big_fil_rev_8_21_14_0_10_35_219]PIY81241.1 MAG: hypothetical protein COY79_03085 [Candidatus Pacearchaeota archaeon CG_4_10_14_0_8_um_filter_35_169]PIZ80170.1 MAG: hypothetical protein COY00_01730 [Candidatus Pacearchaeota archaeon CG_